jgi:tetratricopeptide (TPR) repeat protein
MKKLIVLLGLVFVVGCGSKKVDTAQLAKGNDLIAAGKFDEGIAVLDEMAKQNSDDPALKQARIAAHLKFANYNLFDENADRKTKYRTALKHYRVVLSLDASNAEAKASADQIIAIYNQMGRPVPTE